MNVLLIGSGGRENAIARALSLSASIDDLFAYPGNPGIFEYAKQTKLSSLDFDQIYKFCLANAIDYIFVGPEQPLADGIADFMLKKNIPVFGPSRAAAQLESSKIFAKKFMAKNNIPTAEFRYFSSDEQQGAISYIQSKNGKVVIKADGLAAGKGVVVCDNIETACNTIEEYFGGKFGEASSKILIEDVLLGQEASVFAICDGNNYVVLSTAQDHKRAFDGDKGPNTGGMGAYSPAKIVSKEVMNKVEEKIIKPTLAGMKQDGTPFIGCLYVGLMIDDLGEPYVIEYNVRFGDPETQAVLALFDGDFSKLCFSAAIGVLDMSAFLGNKSGSACTVALVSDGYPEAYQSGFKIMGLENINSENCLVFHAGTTIADGNLVSKGGRVLSITGFGKNLGEAIANSYEGVNKVCFDNIFYRKDIGAKGL